MNENLKKQKSKRLKVLLIILAVVAIGGVLILYFWGPLGEARLFWKCDYNLQLVVDPTEVVADGKSQSQITITVSEGRGKKRSLVSGESVSFATDLGIISSAWVTTDDTGQATVYLVSSEAGQAKVTASLNNCSASTYVNFASSADEDSAGDVIFSDDFSKDLSKWQVAWDGYGTVKIENDALMMSPKAAASSSLTHSALVRAGGSAWGDYIYEVKMNTAQQLRTGSAPNTWEVGWITFRHQDNHRFYYFILKPNGIELGKALGDDKQEFLVTNSTPKLQLGKWNNFRIALREANIKVYVDGALVVDHTDKNNPFLKGGIGLYTEDAKVYYDDVVVTKN